MPWRCQYLANTGSQCSKLPQISPCLSDDLSQVAACSEHRDQPWNFRFMDLPLELREMIIRYYFPARIAARSQTPKSDYEQGLTSVPSILLAAKEISADAQRVLYREVPFVTEINPGWRMLGVHICNQSFGHRGEGLFFYQSNREADLEPDSVAKRIEGFSTIGKHIRNFAVVVNIDPVDFLCSSDHSLVSCLLKDINTFFKLIGQEDNSDAEKKNRTFVISFRIQQHSLWTIFLEKSASLVQKMQEIVDKFQGLDGVSRNLSFASFYIDADVLVNGNWEEKRVRFNVQKEHGGWVVQDGVSTADYENVPAMLEG